MAGLGLVGVITGLGWALLVGTGEVVCVCVCERECERPCERQRENERVL